jgi:amidase
MRRICSTVSAPRDKFAGRGGIPIAVKDIVNTTNMPTTGGAVAFEGIVPGYDAPVVANLKRAGAVIIAKTTLTELANFVTNGMPANYSGLFGFSMNPYDPRPGTNDGRPVLSTGGSSSGTGTALSFWAGSVGTETSGSILSPSSANMLVGIKPLLASSAATASSQSPPIKIRPVR